MRTGLLCVLALLCVSGTTPAQWPASAGYGYYQGYAYTAPSWPRTAWTSPTGYYGYRYNPYGYYYPNYYRYYYPRSSYTYTMPSAQGMATAASQLPPPGLAPVSNPPPAPAPLPVGTPPASQPQQSPAAAPAASPVGDVPSLPPVPSTCTGPAQEGTPVAKGGLACHDHPASPCRFWVSAAYARAWLSPQPLPTPLVTLGDINDEHPGAIGQLGTVILFGGTDLSMSGLNGVRAEAGLFLDDARLWSLEWTGLFFVPNHVRFAMDSDLNGNPLIARPFFNILTSTPVSVGTSHPNDWAGNIRIDARTELLGNELNAHYLCCNTGRFGFGVLLGFRHLRLAEELGIQEHLIPLPNSNLTFKGHPVVPPDSVGTADDFRTTNNFFGLQVGGRLCWEGKWLFASLFGKTGVGGTEEDVSIGGETTLYSPAGSAVDAAAGGVLALPSNIGTRRRAVLGIVSEAGLNFGVKLTTRLQMVSSYSCLFWNQVVRPGRQIDPAINPTMIPTIPGYTPHPTGPMRPAFTFNSESIWVYLMTIGLEYHF